MRLLTFETVERKVETRVEAKAKIFGQKVNFDAEDKGAPPVYKIQPSLVAELYTRRIMPLTKEVQVAYLLRRLD
jgi:chorismate mutase